jgi:hypothetical protein
MFFVDPEYVGIDRKKSINPKILITGCKKVNLFLDIVPGKW